MLIAVTTNSKGAELVVRVAKILVSVAVAADTKRMCHDFPRIERGQIAVDT